ncbi:MAG: hypothetical protein ACTHJL_13185, partial [Amnibacterium sp.]
MRRGPVAVAAVVLVLGIALQLAGPLGLGRLPVLAALVAPREAATAALASAGLIALGLGIRRPLRGAVLPLAVALLATAAVGLPIALARGATAEEPAAPRAGTVRILSWNINGDLVAPEVVARLAAREHADLVVLPEILPAENGPAYAAAFTAAGLRATAVPR